jgi:hypothetical protein
MFSFVDVKHGDWPVALVTNPKHALFVIPAREPVDIVLQSTYIRYFSWSFEKLLKETEGSTLRIMELTNELVS